MDLSEKIKNLIAEQGIAFKEKDRTIYTTCPVCNRNDKFSILKQNGACVCYRASCDFGKRWFTDWLVLTANISYKEARRLLFDFNLDKANSSSSTIEISLSEPEVKKPEIKSISFPERHMVPLNDEKAADGRAYLESRGVPLSVATQYNIHYSPFFRRVYFPIQIDDKVFGYQGRHIDKVPDSQKVRNNEGFSRDSLVMFMNNVKNKNFVIISEGPIDAIKFHNIGANICTMGKVITEKQQKIIFNNSIEKVYLALDEDAANETKELIWSYGNKEIYLVSVPDNVKKRCQELGKKADFGECTFEECALAFQNAKKVDGSELLIYLK